MGKVRVKVATDRWRKWDDVDGVVVQKVRAIIEEVAEFIADRARFRVPVKTGKLKMSIRVEEDSNYTVRVLAGDDDKVYYAGFVEYGLRKSGRKYTHTPFMRPAAAEGREKFRSLVAKVDARGSSLTGTRIRKGKIYGNNSFGADIDVAEE